MRVLPFLAAAAVLSSCSEDRPLKPVPTGLRVFVGGIDYSQPGPARSVLFVYDYDSLTVVDSIMLAAPSEDAAVTVAGDALFVVTTNDQRTRSIWKIDLGTKEPVWRYDLERWPETIEGTGKLRVLNNGRWLLLNRVIASGEDGTLVKALPDTWFPFGGPSSGTRIALGAIAEGSPYPMALCGYDLAEDTSWGGYTPHLLSGVPLSVTYAAVLHPDLQRVLVIGWQYDAQIAWFVIGNLSTGETLLQQMLVYPFGEIAISPDGSRAVVSDPSWTLIYDSWPTLDILDLDSLQPLKRFEWIPGEVEPMVWPGQLSWVPQANVIVAAAPGDGNSVGGGIVIDVGHLTVLGSFSLPGRSEYFEYFTGGMAVGEIPLSH